MRENVNASDLCIHISPEKIETRRVTSSIFEDQKGSLKTADRDHIPDYLKSYQKAQAAALLSHSASGPRQQEAVPDPNGTFRISGQALPLATSCPSCNSCALVRACGPVPSVMPARGKKISIFKRLTSRLHRFE